jgi:hypothetical protein
MILIPWNDHPRRKYSFSLPVITISDSQELINPDYRDCCLNRLVEIIFDLENYLGSARLFIP